MSSDRNTSGPPSNTRGDGASVALLSQVCTEALRTQPLDTLLGIAVRNACAAVGTDLGAFFEFLRTPGTVCLRSGMGWGSAATSAASLPLGAVCPSDSPLDGSEPAILHDIRKASATSELALLRERGVVSGLVVPVERGGSRFGLLGVYTLAPREFTPDDIQLLQAVGAVLSAAATRTLRDREPRDSEARLSGIIASAMDAIIAVDESQTIVLFNHAAESVFRCPADEALGTSLDRFIPARLRAVHREHIQRFGESGATVRRMGRLDPLAGVRSDGEEFPIEASISHAEVGGKRVFTVILRDVSERRRLEEQLLHSQKLESVGRLAGGIAHDFNNLLTGIFGYLDLARGRTEPQGPLRECIDALQIAAQRAAEFTGKLLAFARKQVIEPRVVDLNQLVRGVLGMASRLLGEGVEIVVHQAPLLPNVRVDPGQFEQVLLNLAVNARDAMPKGGKFIVETSCAELDEEYTRFRPDVRPGVYVLLAISDTGAGMDPVTLEHCFEPFFTTKATGRGTGLGLATCHGIVNQSGGHISVYSEPGHGTTFRIFLPTCDAPTQQARPAATISAQAQVGTILLVEDDALVRGIAVRALRDAGYTVLEAADAAEAHTRVTQNSGAIDLLLTDVILPKVGGVELAEQLQELRPALRVLYTSGFTDDMIVHQGVLAPGVSFLAKPYTPSALTAKVREVLQQSGSPRPQV